MSKLHVIIAACAVLVLTGSPRIVKRTIRKHRLILADAEY